MDTTSPTHHEGISLDQFRKIGAAAGASAGAVADSFRAFQAAVAESEKADARKRALDHQRAGGEPREFTPNRAGRRAMQRAARKRNGYTR
jgi:hypothetical protein